MMPEAKNEGEKMRLVNFANTIHLESTDSTNDYVKKHLRSLDDGTVVYADEQTAGKGRLGRKWYGEKGKSVFGSFLIKNVYSSRDAVRISFLFSMAVKMMLSKYIGSEKIILKWPNDIIVSDKKICGILSEYSNECAVIGIGINVLDFEPGGKINLPFTSIESECGFKPETAVIQNELTETVGLVFRRYCTNSLNDIPLIWFREAGIKNLSVTVSQDSRSITGTVDSIDDTGCITVICEGTGVKEKIYFGDLTYND